MSDYHNFYFKKAGNKYFYNFSPVINENHQFFQAFYVICPIRLLALSSAYWAETGLNGGMMQLGLCHMKSDSEWFIW